jgi:hypothetical protein
MSLSALSDALTVLRGQRLGAFAWTDLVVILLTIVCLTAAEYAVVTRRAARRPSMDRLRMFTPGVVALAVIVIVRRMVDY